VKGGLPDREAAFRLVESASRGIFFYFFVVQRSKEGDLPGKRKRDPQAQQMCLFLFYIVVFFAVLDANRLTPPHGLEARRLGRKGFTWVCQGSMPPMPVDVHRCTLIEGRCQWFIWLPLLRYLCSVKSIPWVSCHHPRCLSLRHHQILT